MSATLSDALVLFGVTDDLAHKMTFPGGPKEADDLIAADGCWHNPKIKETRS